MVLMGTLGSILATVAFAAALAAAFLYYRTFLTPAERMLAAARICYQVATGSLVAVAAIFLYLILTHQFQYTYVWQYSSTDLSLPLLVSTFYAGQEGSFMLWALYTSFIGMFLMVYTSRRDYENATMSVYSLILSFLLLMLVVKNPFTMICDSFPAELVKSGPIPPGFDNIVILDAARSIWAQFPTEGSGLNPLLQNYWMVIHPQILFSGFSAMAVPYTLAVAAMMKRDYDSWIRIATPWAVLGSMVLGTGIIMGGYWAYETLGWGGFWGWDPVENSSLIPWLLCVASIHSALNQRKTGGFVRTNIVFSLLTFVTVLYSTFLTRSGILGDTSVHSFVDPGMWVYWLLLGCLGLFKLLGFGLLVFRLPEMPTAPAKHSYFSLEFALFLGAFALSFVALFVMIGTSSPIITTILNGKASAVEISYYVRTNLPLGIIICLLSGIGQLLWWRRSQAETFVRSLTLPITLSLLTTAVVYGVLGSSEVLILLFTFCAAFSLVVNTKIGIEVFKGNPKFVGGSLAHVGIAVMCLGFVTSSRYDSTATLALERGTPVESMGYQLTYLGYEELDSERYAFNVQVKHGGVSKTVAPVMRFSKKDNSTMRHPDIINFLSRDFYVAPVSVESDADQPVSHTLKRGKSEQIGGVTVTFRDFEFPESERASMSEGKPFFINADVRVQEAGRSDQLKLRMKNGPQGAEFLPATYTSKSGEQYVFVMTQMMPAQTDPSASAIAIDVVLPHDHSAHKKEDTLIIEASIKPMINLVWAGTATLIVGFLLTIIRRIGEASREGARLEYGD